MAQFASLTHKKESIEDFYEHFEFYCVANSLHPGEGDNHKKALFLTLLSQGSYLKLNALEIQVF